MKRIVTAVCGLALIGAVSGTLLVHSEPQSFAQQPTPFINKPDIVFSDNPEQAATDEAVFRAVELVEPTGFVVEEPDSLREEYLKLLSRKAELMKDEELAGAFDDLQTEVTELEAGRKLEQISAELQALIDSHPGTAAARRALAMLNPPASVVGLLPPATTESAGVEAATSAESDLQHATPANEEPASTEDMPVDPNQPAFIEFDRIIVNLNEGRLNRYLDASIVLQVATSRRDKVSACLEAEQPILQNWLISHLSEQTVETVQGAAAQERLRAEVKEHFNSTLFGDGDAPIDEVLFKTFVVQ